MPSRWQIQYSNLPDPLCSTARRRRSRSRRIVFFFDGSKPPIEFTGLERLDVSFYELGKFGCFAGRHLASGNSSGERCHCAGRVRGGSQCGQLETYRPLTPRWSVRFEQRQKQMIRIPPDCDRLAVIVADELSGADKRFLHAFDGAPPRFCFERVGGDFLRFFPAGGEYGIGLPELVCAGSAGPSRRDCSRYLPVAASDVKKRSCRALVSFSRLI